MTRLPYADDSFDDVEPVADPIALDVARLAVARAEQRRDDARRAIDLAKIMRKPHLAKKRRAAFEAATLEAIRATAALAEAMRAR